MMQYTQPFEQECYNDDENPPPYKRPQNCPDDVKLVQVKKESANKGRWIWTSQQYNWMRWADGKPSLEKGPAKPKPNYPTQQTATSDETLKVSSIPYTVTSFPMPAFRASTIEENTMKKMITLMNQQHKIIFELFATLQQQNDERFTILGVQQEENYHKTMKHLETMMGRIDDLQKPFRQGTIVKPQTKIISIDETPTKKTRSLEPIINPSPPKKTKKPVVAIGKKISFTEPWIDTKTKNANQKQKKSLSLKKIPESPPEEKSEDIWSEGEEKKDDKGVKKMDIDKN